MAASPTPQPSPAARAMEAKPSSTDFVASWVYSSVRPSSIDPSTVSGPTQKSRLAVTKPSETVECSSPASARWMRSPSRSSQRSIPIASPTSPPSSTPPSTYSGLVSFQASAPSTPITNVTSPRPAITRCWSPSGSRLPTSVPISVPASTVPTLMNVPVTRDGARRHEREPGTHPDRSEPKSEPGRHRHQARRHRGELRALDGGQRARWRRSSRRRASSPATGSA